MPKQIGAERMRELATKIAKEIPGLGFCLIVYPFGENGMANYVSNSQREDMIKFLEETTERLKNKRDFSTPNHN